MKFTREEAIRNFREHWASLAITGLGLIGKDDYLKRNGYPAIRNECFLCEFAQGDCSKCPIEWPATDNLFVIGNPPCSLSYYGDWTEAKTPEERKRLAALIRDLPEKQKKKEPEPDYKVGDWVKVLYNRYSFTYYENFFEENGLGSLEKDYAARYTEVGEVYQIVGIGKHCSAGDSYGPLYAFGPLYALKGRDAKVYIMHNGYIGNPRKGFELTTAPPKFKVGDFVKGNDDDCYTFTNTAMTKGVVIKENGFKVGDRVRVRTDLVAGNRYDGECIFQPDMGRYKGEVTTIGSFAYTPDRYILKGFDRFWSPSMLELLPPLNHCPEPKTITFKFKGAKTTCIIETKKGRFKASAKCSPQDEWKESRGMALAKIRAEEAMLRAGR